MKVLVTGAAGLVGRPLRRLLEADHEVLGADVVPGDGVLELDCTDASAVEDCVATVRPDCIVHLAAAIEILGRAGEDLDILGPRALRGGGRQQRFGLTLPNQPVPVFTDSDCYGRHVLPGRGQALVARAIGHAP